MTTTQQPEALVFADDRPTSTSDDLYQWAIDAEDLIRAQHARIEELEALLSAIGAGGVEPLRKARAASAETKISALMSKISTLVDKRLSCEPCAEAEEDLLQFLRTRYAAAAQSAAQGMDAEIQQAVESERERICAAIKAEDDHCIDQGDYMLDSNDCIKIVRGKWVRPDYSLDAAQAKQGGV